MYLLNNKFLILKQNIILFIFKEREIDNFY